jgi:hypothetical protein
MARRPKPLAFPLEFVTDSPAAAHFTAPELGALIKLCLAYWRGGARPLPSDDTTLMLLSGAHLRTWRMVRGRVLGALEALSAGLASVYARDVAQRAALCSKMARARALIRTNNKSRCAKGGSGAALIPKLATDKNNERVDHVGNVVPARVARGNRPNLRDSARV